jgi:CheY-like chemotaxis protein
MVQNFPKNKKGRAFCIRQVKTEPMHSPHTILLIDDDPDDLEFYGESIRTVKPALVIKEARSGQKALEYLGYAKKTNSLPCLIVLDVNMPVMSGRETLLEIKKDKDLLTIPIVIFSTASAPREKEYFANYEIEFFTKPCSLSEMQLIAHQLLRYCC